MQAGMGFVWMYHLVWQAGRQVGRQTDKGVVSDEVNVSAYIPSFIHVSH